MVFEKTPMVKKDQFASDKKRFSSSGSWRNFNLDAGLHRGDSLEFGKGL